MSTSATAAAGSLEPPPGHDCDCGCGTVSALSLPQLRERRRRLREESERTAHWHRLAKARLDLVVAGALAGDLVAPSGPAGDAVRSRTPHLGSPAPCFASLRDLLLGHEPEGDVVDRLHRLDAAERLLRGYGSSVRAAADEATGELVRRYREAPGTCLAAVPHPG